MLIKYFRVFIYLIVFIGSSAASAGDYEDFFRAVNRDDGRTVNRLIERGFDPNARDPAGQTALHLALRDQSPRVVQALWRHAGLDVNAANASGETPLMLAALRGELEWTARLLERGAKPQLAGWSPLHYAATGIEPRIVAMLLDRGAVIDAPSPNGTTPLMMAARYGAEANVDLLLARGADKGLRNDLGLDAAAFAKLGAREYLLPRLATSRQ